jgi:ABC-2 type transport system ATP-binding protein
MSVIEARNLSRTFDGRSVLRDVSFRVEKGEVFGYLGPNGAGKTTTMRILLGLVHPTEGGATVFGKPLGAREDLRRRVGVLMDNPGLFERLSAAENLDYYARLYGVKDPAGRIEEILAFVGLDDRKNDAAGTFSTGMKRKLGLARALIHRPEVLFLDEPTSGLDPEAQRMVRDLILRLSAEEGITVFLSSHHLDEVQRVSSKVAILDRGVLLAYDTVAALRAGTGRGEIAITLGDPNAATRAVRILSDLPEVAGVAHEGERITAALAGQQAAPLVTALVRAGIAVEEARRTSRSLEEIYLEVVSRTEAAA